MYLQQGGAYASAEDFACRCVVQQAAPFLLLVPTGRTWTARATEILRQHQCLAVPLNRVVRVAGQEWTATDAWSDYKASFRQIVEPNRIS